jgi:hypothetical protein
MPIGRFQGSRSDWHHCNRYGPLFRCWVPGQLSGISGSSSYFADSDYSWQLRIRRNLCQHDFRIIHGSHRYSDNLDSQRFIHAGNCTRAELQGLCRRIRHELGRRLPRSSLCSGEQYYHHSRPVRPNHCLDWQQRHFWPDRNSDSNSRISNHLDIFRSRTYGNNRRHNRFADADQ